MHAKLLLSNETKKVFIDVNNFLYIDVNVDTASPCNRLLRWRNAYRLFYGLFFADSPLAKRHIQSRASSIIKRRSRAPFEGSRRSILQGINLELSALIIERAPMNVLKRINQSATNDLMKHFKKKVLAAETKRIQSRKNSRSGMPFIQKRRQDVLQAGVYCRYGR